MLMHFWMIKVQLNEFMKEPISVKPVIKFQLLGSLFKIILSMWLIAGTFDICIAILQTLASGGKPIRMLQFIASGIFGPKAFSGGVLFAIYGLLLHYVIAYIWVLLFFKVYNKLGLLRKNRILAGIMYGLFIWIFMNLIVMPISNTPSIKFSMVKAVISMLVIIGAIGIPLSFVANKFFSKGVALKEVHNTP